MPHVLEERTISAAASPEPRRTAVLKRVAWGVLVVWALCFTVPMAARGDRYVIGYTMVLGAFLLAIRRPVARTVSRSGVPRAASFLVLSTVMCVVEVWFRLPIGSMEFVQGFLVLLGWCVGVYVAARLLRLGMIELWLVTGLAGWFQEGLFFKRFALFSAGGVLVLAWSVWAYAMLVLIPVSLVPGPDTTPATSGRAWRYPAAFAIPIAFMLMFLLLAGALKAALRA